MNVNRSLLPALILATVFRATVATADGPASTNALAEMFGRNVSAADLGSSGMTMLDLIWREVGDRYAKKNDLLATDQECEAYEKSLIQVEEQEKRKRELNDLEQQLKSEDLSEAKRNQLENHRKMLLSLLSGYDRIRKIPQEIKRRGSRQWVTAHKVYKAIYEQYGGKVSITAFGPYPIEARRKLIEEHMRAGDIRFLDADYEAQFWKDYEKGGRSTARKDQIDFTPYWLKPVPDNPESGKSKQAAPTSGAPTSP